MDVARLLLVQQLWVEQSDLGARRTRACQVIPFAVLRFVLVVLFGRVSGVARPGPRLLVRLCGVLDA
jgi:hypothetical protein